MIILFPIATTHCVKTALPASEQPETSIECIYNGIFFSFFLFSYFSFFFLKTEQAQVGLREYVNALQKYV